MSLTEREKEIALECFEMYTPTGDGEEKRRNVINMFDLFLSGIREGQEAVAEVSKGNFNSRLMWTEYGEDTNIPVGTKLFTIPPATLPNGNRSECDCSELVKVLDRILKWVAPIAGDNSDRRAAAEEEMSMIFAHKAIANHAKRMKGKRE